MKVGDRIRELRKNVLGMTQADFAQRIQTSRSNLGNVEISTFEVTDRMLNDICREFDVNREWLESGEGKMFRDKTREEEILDWATSLVDVDNKFKRQFVYALTKLDEAGWRVIERFAQALYEEQLAEDEQKKKDEGK